MAPNIETSSPEDRSTAGLARRPTGFWVWMGLTPLGLVWLGPALRASDSSSTSLTPLGLWGCSWPRPGHGPQATVLCLGTTRRNRPGQDNLHWFWGRNL